MEVNKCRSKSDPTRKWHHFSSVRCTAEKMERQKHSTRENTAAPLTVQNLNTLVNSLIFLASEIILLENQRAYESVSSNKSLI